ncbi:UNKNOWN [Stylonychia lemnae]|uniref:Uncharacterized protein n=1 Tax=Stylonychia lemnae TaxID=5949 RepID=A0A077ZT91_STYLE|nr:UNKNOWN [Stylonychia lemnae]|eukprot:CDW73102.1 UNKNOWN [Stylonychia lemnae]
MSTTLKDIKQNYQAMESQIVEMTKKQRQDQLDKHKTVLAQIDALKQFLKSEVANRKETEQHFNQTIEARVAQITEQFNITYLNQLYEMKDQIGKFETRQQRMEMKSKEIKHLIDTQLQKQKQEFHQAYETQKDNDTKELKYIGELEYNFDNMLSLIQTQRHSEFLELQSLIDQNINDTQVYQNQEKTRKILFSEINNLKTKCKLEIDSRRQADEDISEALDKYHEIISKEVENKRQEIRQKNQ